MPDFRTRPLHRFVPGVGREIRIGQMRPRWNRLGKNQRWYLVRRRFIRKVGWGDLAAADLDLLAEHLGGREAFVVLPENPRGAQHLPHPVGEAQPGWCWYDQPDCVRVTPETLAPSAIFAVLNSAVLHVTTSLGPEVTLAARFDFAAHGPVEESRRYPTISPDALTVRLHDLLGG